METPDFNTVTPSWIKRLMEEKRVLSKQLAEGVNVSPPRVSKWLSGEPISPIARAAIYWFFESLG